MSVGVDFNLESVLDWVQGKLENSEALGPKARSIEIQRMSPIAGARKGDLVFFFSKKYQADLLKSQPSVLITGHAFIGPMKALGLERHPLWSTTAIVSTADPYLAMARVSEKFADPLSTTAHVARKENPAPPVFIDPRAVVHPTAVLEPGVRVEAGAVVGAGARIGAGTILYPHVTVGPNAQIGQSGVLFSNVTIYENVRIGNRVRLHAGVVIGSDGFGYAPVLEGTRTIDHQKIHHLGTVIIGDDVEIGANSCVDRGTLENTIIEDKVKIDNLVQIAHNCRIKKGAILCGMVGLAGSVEVGEFCVIGGMTGVANQTKIGDRTRVGGGTGLFGDVPADQVYMGNPYRSVRDYWKIQASLERNFLKKKSRRKGIDHERDQ